MSITILAIESSCDETSAAIIRDGDGNATEPLTTELEGMGTKLMTALTAKAGVCYGAGIYPYFFKDTDMDGKCSAAEAVSTNGFSAWTADLVKAAHNYQISRVEPGAWADLIVVDGNPIKDLNLFQDQGAHLPAIMKAGKFHKNGLV